MFKTPRPNLYDYLKIIAVVTMIVDHVGFFFFPEVLWLRAIGRIAFPIFLILVGFNGSYKFKRSLWGYGLALQIPLSIAIYLGLTDVAYFNILLGIAITRVILGAYEPYFRYRHIAIVAMLVRLLQPQSLLYVDYGVMLVLFATFGMMLRQHQSKFMTNGFRGVAILGLHAYFQLSFDFSVLQRGSVALGYAAILGAFLMLSKENVSLRTGRRRLDRGVLLFSHYALQVYVVQAIILVGLSLVIR